jgi:DNA (cytosine-5)-methyltransferase 1
MRILDLYSGAGGAAAGYVRAGWEAVGVDIVSQGRYPYAFYQGGALAWLEAFLTWGHWPMDLEFDAIHASPPCQFYSVSKNNGTNTEALDLVPATLALLRQTGLPWVCENVPGAPLPSAVELCGASFGLGTAGLDLARHRAFETNWPLMAPPCQHRRGQTVGVYGHGTNSWHRELIGRNITVAEMREAMGIDWMDRATLTQAIPPAYTEYIGRELLSQLSSKTRFTNGGE